MSLLSAGNRCSVCPLVDFLPFTCPHCTLPYCGTHITSHTCTQGESSSNTSKSAIGKLGRGKRLCDFGECERERMESVAGLSGGSGDGDGDDEERERIAKEVRCEGCGGGFCVAHRAQTSHSCSAPLIHEKRYDAFLSRRTQAQEILAQHFPEQVGRVIPKPPPGREVIKKRPKSPERSPPSVQATLSSSSTSGLSTSNENATAQTSSASKKPKTKAEKLWEIQIRKIKMGAKPLSPTGSGSVADDEKRFFEWGVDLERKGVKGWKDGGKWTGKVERVWIGVNTPVGKVMDLIIAQAKVPRPKSDDPAQALGLLSLYPPPDGERTVTPLELSKSVGQAIQEGSMIVLIRGEV